MHVIHVWISSRSDAHGDSSSSPSLNSDDNSIPFGFALITFHMTSRVTASASCRIAMPEDTCNISTGHKNPAPLSISLTEVTRWLHWPVILCKIDINDLSIHVSTYTVIAARPFTVQNPLIYLPISDLLGLLPDMSGTAPD